MSVGIMDGNCRGIWTPQVIASCSSVAANTTAQQTINVPGLKLTDLVFEVNKGTFQPGLGILSAGPSALDTLQITFINCTASPIVPTASDTYTIQVLRPDGVTLPTSIPR